MMGHIAKKYIIWNKIRIYMNIFQVGLVWLLNSGFLSVCMEIF